jgi:hypothetical protein
MNRNDVSTVLVVDAMGICHNIINTLRDLDTTPRLDQYVNAQLEWLGSGLFWKGFNGIAPNVVFCWDSKPYWRSEYLLRDDVWTRITPIKRKVKQAPAPIHYKGGRSVPPQLMSLIKATVSQRCELKGFHSMRLMANESYGYEADDIASLLVQVNRASQNPKQIALLTRDKDWMGMIGKEVTWLCCNNDTPRVRTLENYASCFSKVQLREPSDIWLHKALTGDASDNLPNCGGCPESAEALLPVISLFSPPSQFDLMQDSDAVLEAHRVLDTPTPGTPNAEKAVRSLRSVGLVPCVQLIY